MCTSNCIPIFRHCYRFASVPKTIVGLDIHFYYDGNCIEINVRNTTRWIAERRIRMLFKARATRGSIIRVTLILCQSMKSLLTFTFSPSTRILFSDDSGIYLKPSVSSETRSKVNRTDGGLVYGTLLRGAGSNFSKNQIVFFNNGIFWVMRIQATDVLLYKFFTSNLEIFIRHLSLLAVMATWVCRVRNCVQVPEHSQLKSKFFKTLILEKRNES